MRERMPGPRHDRVEPERPDALLANLCGFRLTSHLISCRGKSAASASPFRAAFHPLSRVTQISPVVVIENSPPSGDVRGLFGHGEPGCCFVAPSW